MGGLLVGSIRFDSLDDAKEKIDHWRWDYDERPPHRSLEGLTRRECALWTGQQGVANLKPWVSDFCGSVKQLPSIGSSLSVLMGATPGSNGFFKCGFVKKDTIKPDFELHPDIY